MVLSHALFHESTSPPSRQAAAVAHNRIQQIHNEENMKSSVNKSNDDTAPAAAGAAATAMTAKAKKGFPKKQVPTPTPTATATATATAQTVTVGAVDQPHFFRKIIRKHFLDFITLTDKAMRLLIIHQVLDDMEQGEHSIKLGNEILSPDMCHDSTTVTDWIDMHFHSSFAKESGPKDVACGSNRPNYRCDTSKDFVGFIKENVHRVSGAVPQLAEEIMEKGLRFLLYMEPGIYYVLDKRDDEVKARVGKALDNHRRHLAVTLSDQKRMQSMKGTNTKTTATAKAPASTDKKRIQSKKGTKTTAAAKAPASTSLAGAAKISTSRPKRQSQPRSLEDPEDFPSKRPKLEHNPDLSSVKIGSKIAVYWSGDMCYYGGEVTKYKLGENGEKTSFCVDYDDGQDEWTDLRKQPFMMQSYQDDDNDSLASSPITRNPFENIGTDRNLGAVQGNTVVSSGPGEGQTNLVVKLCHETEVSNLGACQNVGFIIGLSLQSTFVEVREAIDKNALDGLPAGWKFYIPDLAVMSSSQESSFTVGSFPYLGNDNPRVIYVGPR
jgi:hypothetical protein